MLSHVRRRYILGLFRDNGKRKWKLLCRVQGLPPTVVVTVRDTGDYSYEGPDTPIIPLLQGGGVLQRNPFPKIARREALLLTSP